MVRKWVVKDHKFNTEVIKKTISQHVIEDSAIAKRKLAVGPCCIPSGNLHLIIKYRKCLRSGYIPTVKPVRNSLFLFFFLIDFAGAVWRRKEKSSLPLKFDFPLLEHRAIKKPVLMLSTPNCCL